MTLSKDKCQFRQTKITYLGETHMAHGVKSDETKVEAIKKYPKPTNKHDVQRLLGMVNFIAKFAPNISDVTAPLRELIKKNVAFHWLETHEKAFRDLQHLLTDPATLRYYDVAGPVTLQVDASQNGLGAALIQNQGPSSLRIESHERHTTTLRTDQKGTAGCCFCLQKIPSVRLW